MPRVKKLILKNGLSPGDIVLLTAAVRDLHLCHPGRYLTDVRTPCPELWENNPYLTPLDERDRSVEVLPCHYPLVHRSNEAPYHCIHGFAQYLGGRLGLPIQPQWFKGDIHLSGAEKSWISQVEELAGIELPFWIVAAGGKYDYTIKWWDVERFQAVVDHFQGKIQFVQVGEAGHYHPRLSGVIDLRGRTTLRELVRLVYHAQGVLCPVTLLMHLAPAIEPKPPGIPYRPCVVVAGGREPAHWEAYPFHQFIHTVGALPCCADGGCWKSRTRPLGDHSELDRPENLCANVAGHLPRCMEMITAGEVIRRIETYFQGGALGYLTADQARAAKLAAARTADNPFDEMLNAYTARAASELYLEKIPNYPGGYAGRGIVICGGGVTYFPAFWVCARMLRKMGCTLPVELWHLGSHELDGRWNRWLAPLQVQCVNAEEIQRAHPARRLSGWELKPYALLHSSFREVLLLDADNVPVANPEFLFESRAYQRTGAIFWPDEGRLKPDDDAWRIFGVPYRDEPEFETGQILADKERCWKALCLSLWYNERSDFYYRHSYGDKETFHFAFRKLGQPYAMVPHPVQILPGTMCQHDFAGRRIFQHRNRAKWQLFGRNPKVRGFRYEKECLQYLKQLQPIWEGRVAAKSILIQQASGLFTHLLDLSGPGHANYAVRYGMTFWSIRGGLHLDRPPVWNKIYLIQQALKLDFEFVVWLDADALIVNPEADLREAFPPGPPVGMCRHPGRWRKSSTHYNSGVIFVRNTPLARRYFDAVWKAGPSSHRWQEQTRMNELAEEFPRAVQALDPRWNSTENVNPSSDPVIKAWHGYGQKAAEHMKAAVAAAAILPRSAA